MIIPNIKEIRDRVEATTPGPWDLICYPHGGGRIHVEKPRTLIADVYQTADREFITYSKSDIISLLDYIDELEKKLEIASKNAQGAK